MSYNAKNYTEQGGEKTVIGGILEFTDEAQVVNLPAGGLSYASADRAGVVKIGDGLVIDADGVLSLGVPDGNEMSF